MESIARFQKVSLEQFRKDWVAAFPEAEPDVEYVYESIILPSRATQGSAGYDFHTTLPFELSPQESILIPTGIRAEIAPGWVLLLFPRSSLGFKYRFQLDNCVGVIDSDYAMALNEGHIFLKMTNNSLDGKLLEVRRGDSVAQGIFLPFGLAEGDHVSAARTGGFGSTDGAAAGR